MVLQGQADRLLLVSPAAGGVTAELRAQMAALLPDHVMVDFDPDRDFLSEVGPEGTVLVAGGDGTVSQVARRLAGTGRRLGILPLGTFNNFARSLGVPAELDAAVEVVRKGELRPVTLGCVNGHRFLELAAVGLFGAAIALGEAAKERAFGELADRAHSLAGAKRFEYELSGDLSLSGRTLSLAFSNTPSTGASLPLGSGTPEDPYLELSLHARRSPADLVQRVLESSLLGRASKTAGPTQRFRRLRVVTEPAVEVYADTELVGRTPAEVWADRDALQVLLPPSA